MSPDADAPEARDTPDLLEAPAEPDAEVLARTEEPRGAARAEAARTAEPAHAPRRVMSAAWLRAALEQTPGLSAADGQGWRTLRLRLEDDHGTVTLRTRREGEAVHVAVGFSDPALRAAAAQGADRIEDALRQHYRADVDLQFGGGEAGSRGHDGRPARPAGGSGAGVAGPGGDGAESPASENLAVPNGWVG